MSDPDEPGATVQTGPSSQSNLVRLRQLLKERARESSASRPPQASHPAPTPSPTAKVSKPARPAGRIPETDLWTLIVQIARSRWERHVKSFLVDERIAIKYDTLHGMLTSAVREKGLARHIGNDGFDKVLKDHGVRIDCVQPPAGWGTSVSVRCCLFPLSVLQPPPKPQPSPQAAGLKEGAIPSPPMDEVGRMRTNLLHIANELLLQGKALTVDGRKAVKVSDLCTFYPPWNERDMGQHLNLLNIRTARPWISSVGDKVTVWFAWE